MCSCLNAHYLPFNSIQYDLYNSTYTILHVEAEKYLIFMWYFYFDFYVQLCFPPISSKIPAQHNILRRDVLT
jgi:hypothetical protein